MRETKMSSKDKFRGTFVGTAIYVAPEMLEDSVSGPFSDLWALGVVIFFIVTNGSIPWGP